MAKNERLPECECMLLTDAELENAICSLLNRYAFHPCGQVEQAILHYLAILDERTGLDMSEDKQEQYSNLMKNWQSRGDAMSAEGGTSSTMLMTMVRH